MGKRLVDALEEGLVFGVKWGSATLAVLFLSGALGIWLAQDYGATRTRALKGEAAFNYIGQQLEANKARVEEPKPEE
jgi:hypothetical protein